MNDNSRSGAPIPLRVIFGLYFILTGFPKLFTVAGHNNIVYQLGQLNIPLPEVVCWGVGSIEFFGGLLLLAGFLTTAAAALNIFSTGGHLLFALMSGQFPSGGFPPPQPPLTGFPYTLPEYGFSLLLIGGLLTLIIGGAGAYSVDRWVADPQPPLTPFQFSKEQKADIQGIILSGYGHLNFGAYLFLQFTDAAKAKAWIREITPEIATSEDYESEEIPLDHPVASVEAAQAWLVAKHPQRFSAIQEQGTRRRYDRAFVLDQNHEDLVGQVTVKKARDAIKIKWKPAIRINVAFTYGGLDELGVPQETLLSFSREFIIGMSTRSSILGDIGESAPEHWELGGTGRRVEHGKLREQSCNDNPPLHAVLMFAALDQRTLDRHVARYKQAIEANSGLIMVSEQGGSRPPDQHEPFGFHDGVSNPKVQGLLGYPTPNQWVIPTGDFVLGYLDGYDVFAPSPVVRKERDPDDILPMLPDRQLPQFHDLGCNGSYIVYRKLEQDVAGFWKYMHEEAMAGSGSQPQHGEIIKLASKCVGRWPSGAPVVLTPDYDDPKLWQNDFFTYMQTDPEGFGCPLGAHIRRANPRDALAAYDTPEESFRSTVRHRIARRSVSFGPEHPFDPAHLERGVVPPGVYEATEPRGIHFFAINTDIARQFEFVQDTWVNDGDFRALYNNKGPLLGDNNPGAHDPSRMVIQRDPVRRTMAVLPRFVAARGGDYFFMPGIRALHFLGKDYS
ncbi:MAG TPA: DoxX family membrane protein [Candidatus Acidoferrales bacterium]|nr:DoxX family membrane protein [Candidatus Acidoferrales bacterium]